MPTFSKVRHTNSGRNGAVQQRADRPARGPRGRAGRQYSRRLPGQVGPAVGAEMGVGWGRRRAADLRRHRHRGRLHDRRTAVRAAGDRRWLTVDHGGGLRHLDDLLDALDGQNDRQGPARQAVRRAGDRPGGGRGHGVPRGRSRGPGDHGVLLRERAYRRNRAGRAADRLRRRHHRRRRARLVDLPRCRPVQPGEVLHLHGCPAGVRRGRHPRLRPARPAGGRGAAGPEHARVRPVRPDAGGLLVRRVAQGPAQLLRPDHGPAGRRVGALRRGRADHLPVAAQATARAGRRLSVPRSSQGALVTSTRAVLTGTFALFALAACGTATPTESSGGAIAVAASDDKCEVARTSHDAGTITFEVTNKGSRVTEFYLYADGDRIMGEVENITPGLTRRLIVEVSESGKYQTACKPGMQGKGIRGAFTVNGDAKKATDTD